MIDDELAVCMSNPRDEYARNEDTRRRRQAYIERTAQLVVDVVILSLLVATMIIRLTPND